MSILGTIRDIGLVGADIATLGNASKWAGRDPYDNLGVYGDVAGFVNKVRPQFTKTMLNVAGASMGIPGAGNIIDTNPNIDSKAIGTTQTTIPQEGTRSNPQDVTAESGISISPMPNKGPAPYTRTLRDTSFFDIAPEGDPDPTKGSSIFMEGVKSTADKVNWNDPFWGFSSMPAKGSKEYGDRYNQQFNRIANVASLVDLFGAVSSYGYLNRMGKYQFNSAARPETIDPVNPTNAFRTVLNADNQKADKYFNSIVRSSREQGTTPNVSPFLEEANNVAAKRNESLISILSRSLELNASIQEKNAVLNSDYRKSMDQENLLNQQRKEQIEGAKSTIAQSAGKSILQNYLSSIQSQSQII